jgi:hypothetical protein
MRAKSRRKILKNSGRRGGTSSKRGSGPPLDEGGIKANEAFAMGSLDEGNAKANGTFAITKFLSTSADDRSIHTTIFGILDRMDIFVDTFYRSVAASVSENATAALTEMNDAYLPRPVPLMLHKSAYPKPVITHCLSARTVAAISPSGDSSLSLLPKGYCTIPALKKQSNPGNQNSRPLSLSLEE